MARPIVVVTGASSGIGRAIALGWAKRGATVVLSARSEAALEAVAREAREPRELGPGRDGQRGDAIVVAGDVTVESDRKRLVARAVQAGGVDVLVNNAGRGYYGSARSIDPDDLLQIFALNVVAPLRLAQLSLDALARTSGSIVMMSSIAGVVAAPRLGAYAASKFALEAIAMSLRAEIAESGVKVVVVRPGPVDTPFRANSVTTDGQPGVRPPGARVQTPDAIAEKTIRAVERGHAVVETSPFVKLASATARHAPAAFRMIARRMATRSE